MKLFEGEFVKGVIGNDYKTKDGFPQIAFFGRSNAGKSSVINSLTNRKNLAKSSKTPGKTREANFFRMDDSFYLVDFPGYGYAKRPVKERDKIIKRIFWYLSNEKPRAVFLIIDSKVGLTLLDREMIKVLKKNNHQIVIVANKADKLSKEALLKQLLMIEKELPEVLILPYSSRTKEGREKLIEKIISFI